MSKEKIKLIATLALIIVFLFILNSIFKRSKGRKIKKEQLSSAASITPQDYYSKLKEKFDKMGWKRDPFRLVTQKQAAAASYLQGIVWGPDSPAALFGGKFLKIGDKVEGYKIMDIKRKSVILTNGENVYELGMGESLDNLE